MAFALPNNSSLKILEVCQVAPATDSTVSATELTIPLTFFDARYFRFPPVERVYFYKLSPELPPSFFHSEIIPTLKLALSKTLIHFLPLAGHLTWPPNSPRPIIVYTPNDAVSFTVAESSADFEHLTGNQIREATEARPYIPELLISETMASIIALQITLFANKGFSIGISMNHAVLDGKSASMFLKAWAYICKEIKINNRKTEITPLLPELVPSFDRSTIKDPDGLEPFYLNQWRGLDSESNCRSVKLLPHLLGISPKLVRATFHLTHERIEKIRESILSYHNNNHRVTEQKPIKHLHLSKMVITCAYVSVCLVKIRRGDSKRKVYFLVPVDCRNRLEYTPIPQNYFGNCLYVIDTIVEAGTFMEENGVAIIAEKLSDSIKEFELSEKGLFHGVKERHARMRGEGAEVQKLGITGTPRFAYYEEDFGWGKPEKVDIVSIDRVNGISLMEGRDGNGGIEIGLVLPTNEMEAFASLFFSRSKCSQLFIFL